MAKIRTLTRAASWTLSPSDFAFLWDDCPYCFYMKVARKSGRPRTPFPKVFTLIDGAMKDFYLGERSEGLAHGLPPGVIGGGDRWVKSTPIVPPGCSTACVIHGRVDTLLNCDDGSTGVIDFKTSEPKAPHVDIYGRQLHGYALALEQPASGPAAVVSTLGLLCFMPGSYEAEQKKAALFGDLSWVEIERNNDAFLLFLADVVAVLEQPEPPTPSPSCSWCGWREEILRTG
jgi:hypothetical protein